MPPRSRRKKLSVADAERSPILSRDFKVRIAQLREMRRSQQLEAENGGCSASGFSPAVADKDAPLSIYDGSLLRELLNRGVSQQHVEAFISAFTDAGLTQQRVEAGSGAINEACLPEATIDNAFDLLRSENDMWSTRDTSNMKVRLEHG